jgi:hypothetical protein
MAERMARKEAMGAGEGVWKKEQVARHRRLEMERIAGAKMSLRKEVRASAAAVKIAMQ